ncbi:citrate/2-methylcitrate synthase [Tardisphaera miroshnichenkoae]
MDSIYKSSGDACKTFQTDERLSPGLEQVYIKPTKLTYIDGEAGELRYLGYNIKDIIAAGARAEEIQYAFLHGSLPNREELQRFVELIESGYDLPDYVVDAITSLPRSSDAVGMQSSAIASLAAVSDLSWSHEKKKDFFAVMLGQMSAITAVSLRHAIGKRPKLPSPGGTYAESFLTALSGEKPAEAKAKAMNDSVILYMDHEVPASTTAGLVTASTLADPYSSVLSALSALRGPLHGGATEGVMSQLREIGDPSSVETWFRENVLSGKRRLMGFGHRVYKSYDPRALAFKSMALELATDSDTTRLLSIALKLEELGLKSLGGKRIYPNADFYSPIVYACIGIPCSRGSYTAVFALSRLAGWLAHFDEYLSFGGRIIRPRALYVGSEKRPFPPPAERRLRRLMGAEAQ